MILSLATKNPFFNSQIEFIFPLLSVIDHNFFIDFLLTSKYNISPLAVPTNTLFSFSPSFG